MTNLGFVKQKVLVWNGKQQEWSADGECESGDDENNELGL